MGSLKITIDKDNVSGSLVNFPYLFSEDCSGIPASFWSEVTNPSGMDIRFYDTDIITELKREIVSFDSINSGIEAWVQIPSGVSSVTDKVIYCIYGGSTIANDSGVWTDINAVSVLHFTGADASTSFVDNSGKTWTAKGNAQIDTAIKKFNSGAGLFDATTNTSIQTPDHADFYVPGDYAIDFWMRSTAVNGGMLFYQGDESGLSTTVSHMLYTTVYPVVIWTPDYTTFPIRHGLASLADINDGGWHHFVCTRVGNAFTIYEDGALINSVTFAYTAIDEAYSVSIGILSDTYPNAFIGSLDEFRFYKGYTINADWVLTEENNQRYPNTFSKAEEIELGSSSSNSSNSSQSSLSEFDIEDISQNGSKHFNTRLTNRRLIPYSVPNDKIQAKVEFLKNNKLSYKKDLDVILYLNAYGWEEVASGVTNDCGIYDFKVNTSYLETSPVYFCSGVAQVIYDGNNYLSNAVRFNFYDNTPFPSSASSASSSSASSVSASSKSSESSSKSSTSSESSASKSSSSSVSQQTSSSASSKSSWSTASTNSTASSRSSRSSGSSVSSSSFSSVSSASASSKSSESSSKSSESSSKSSESSSKSSESSSYSSESSSKSSESSSKSSESSSKSSESSSKSSESSSKSSESSSFSSLSTSSSESSESSSASSETSSNSSSSESSSTEVDGVVRIGAVVSGIPTYQTDYIKSMTINIPSDAELIIASVMTQCSGTDLYASGVDLDIVESGNFIGIENYDTGSGHWISNWYKNNIPVTGSQTLLFSLNNIPNEEVTAFVSYYKNVDSVTPISASGYAYINDGSTTNASMGSLFAMTGDAIVATAYIKPTSWSTSWTNATELVKATTANHIAIYSEKLRLTGNTTTELDISGSSGWRFVVLAGFVINYG